MKKYLLLILLLFLTPGFCDSLIDSNEDKALDKVSLQLHWKYQFEFAGFIAAIEKGFYKDVGLAVELKEYEFGMDIVDDVVSGKSNFGVYGSNIIVSRLNKKPIKLLASFFKRSALVLITKDSIKSPTDLIGKKIMATGEKDFIFNFKSMLDEFKVDVKDLNLFPHTYNTKDFIEGTVDAMTAYISDQPFELNEKGIKYNILDPSNYGVFSYQLELFTSEYEIQANPKRVQNFRDATIKGWEYALNNPDEIIDIIYEKYSKRKTKEALAYEAKEIKKLILPQIYNVGLIDENFINRSKELLIQQYKIMDNGYFNNYIYNNNTINKVKLTKEEKEYIEKHKIKWSTTTNWAPFNFYDQNNILSGISIDYWKKIIEYSNIQEEFITSKTWQDVLKKIDSKEIDLTIGTSFTKDKEELGYFSKSYASFPVGIATQNDNIIISDISQLNYRKVAVGLDYTVHHILKEKYPKIILVPVKNVEEALKLLSRGEVYACVDILPSLVYYISKHGFANINISGTTEFNFELCAMVNKDDKILLDIINKAIDLLNPIEKQKIYNKWISIKNENSFDYKTFMEVFFVALFIILVIIYWNRTLTRTKNELKKSNEKLNELNLKLEEKIKVEVNKRVAQEHILSQQNKLASMGEMINDIAHQWRQPLAHINSIILNIDLAFSKNKLNQTLLENKLDEIENITKYMSNTINDFQNFFKPDKTLENFDIKNAVLKSLKLYETIFHDNDIKVNCNLDESVKVLGYENEYIQIIMAILNNARYVLNERDIKNKTINISLLKKDVNSILTIEDNAGGIKEQDIHKVFEPYFTTKHKNQGTGLGLYISKMIIEKSMNGKLLVENSDIGAKFSIVL